MLQICGHPLLKMKKIIQYFDKEAKTYNLERAKGILGYMVKKETELVLKLIEPKKGEKILDAGCGSGYYSLFFKNIGADPFGVDISPGMVKLATQNGINSVVADLENVKLKKKFDKILISGSLEFCNNPLNVLKNMSSHLKRGGYLGILFPKRNLFGNFYFLFHLRHGFKIKLIRNSTFRKILINEGFEDIKIYKANLLADFLIAKKKVEE